MSYHDYHRTNNTGITVVSPLIKIERKLKRIQEVLDNISDASILTDLKIKIQHAMEKDD